MSQYRPPLDDIRFLLEHVFDFDQHAQEYHIGQDCKASLAIGRKIADFAAGRMGSIDRPAETYRAFCEAGWNRLRFPAEYGGRGASAVMAVLLSEMWPATGPSVACSTVSSSTVAQAIAMAGSEQLKRDYLPGLVDGDWTGAIGFATSDRRSDLTAVRSKGRVDDSYLLRGRGAFADHGEHGLAGNVIHLIPARTPDAARRGDRATLFVVPAFVVDSDGTRGKPNDIRRLSTGDVSGVVGYALGEEAGGMDTMSFVASEARFLAGLQGLSSATRAYRNAISVVENRGGRRGAGRTGDAAARCALLSMKSRIDAMRSLAIYVAMQKDVADSAAACDRARDRARSRVGFLIPVVKGWLTESAQAIASDALALCAGIDNADAVRHCDDARQLATFAGATAVQAGDLVCRNTLLDHGATAFALIETVLDDIQPLGPLDHAAARPLSEHLINGLVALRNSVQWFLKTRPTCSAGTCAGAVPYLELWGLVCGGWMHLCRLRAAQRDCAAREQLATTALAADYFAGQLLVRAPALAAAIRMESSLTTRAKGVLEHR